ncbi:hypothetical protein ACQJBY_002240 [Aegilops geniculata]
MRPQLQSSPRSGPGRYHCRPQQEERGTQRRPAPPCSCAAIPLPFSSAAPQASRWTTRRALVTRRRRMALADAALCSSRLCRALLRLVPDALCSGLSSPRSAPACHRKGCASVQGADWSPDPSATPWTSPGARAGRRRRQPATPTPTPTNPAPQEVEAESTMLVSGPPVAVSGLRRVDCRTVPTLMKMNVSCSSMPVGISEKTAKEAEDNVLPREMVNSAINLDN